MDTHKYHDFRHKDALSLYLLCQNFM